MKILMAGQYDNEYPQVIMVTETHQVEHLLTTLEAQVL